MSGNRDFSPDGTFCDNITEKPGRTGYTVPRTKEGGFAMEHTHIYDTVIIGGGPGGYTAALYAARAGLDTLILEKMAPGGQMALTGDIENYPGFDEGIDGFTLGMKMQQGAEK